MQESSYHEKQHLFLLMYRVHIPAHAPTTAVPVVGTGKEAAHINYSVGLPE